METLCVFDIVLEIKKIILFVIDLFVCIASLFKKFIYLCYTLKLLDAVSGISFGASFEKGDEIEDTTVSDQKKHRELNMYLIIKKDHKVSMTMTLTCI